MPALSDCFGDGLANWTIATETLRVLDQLLVVLKLVEILHTVRIAIRSHILLAAEPFLVVGVIASIRRILIISLHMAALTKEGEWSGDGASIFHASMVELSLLVVLILVLVVSITLLAALRHRPERTQGDHELAIRGRIRLSIVVLLTTGSGRKLAARLPNLEVVWTASVSFCPT